MRGLPLALLAIAAGVVAPAAASAAAGAGTSTGAPRIVGGAIAPAGSWPSIAALESRAGGQFCGGTLIDPYWVLTAGHCRIFNPSQMRVVLGRQDLDADDGEVREVAALVRHPDYRMAFPGAPRNDLMLVRLQTPATGPVMAIAPEAAPLPAGVALTVAGWGSTSYVARTDTFGPGSVRLRQTGVRNLAPERCRDPYGRAYAANVMLCAAERGRDACAGDSGGPLVEAVDGVARQVGIVSWGTGCALRDYPGVYTRVGHYACWITTTTQVPRAPEAVVVAPEADGAQVRWAWNPGCRGGAGVRGFRITVQPGGQTIEVGGGVRSVRVGGYAPGTPLEIAVTPFNRSGAGAASGASLVTGEPAARVAALRWTGFGRARLVARIAPHPDRSVRFRLEWGQGLGLQRQGAWSELPPSAETVAVPLELSDLSPERWYVRVVVEEVDGSAPRTSAVGELDSPQPPRARSRPRIVGATSVGNVVRCTPGTWTGTRPLALRVRWTRDDLPIAGAAGTRYRLVAADRGRAVRCKVLASGPGGVRTAASGAIRPS